MHWIVDVGTSLLMALGFAGLGWGIVIAAARIERERKQRHTERFGEPQ